MKADANKLRETLWRIYRRPAELKPWDRGGNLSWNDPEFSKRMLAEHLDESHGAASRQAAERNILLDWLWEKSRLEPGSKVLDVTCGPGLYAVELAARGCQVTGIDFSPASIDHARKLAADRGVADRCTFILEDVQLADFGSAAGSGGFDAALFLYGQFAVFPIDSADMLMRKISKALRPGGVLCVELLDQDKVDKENSTWWFTDDKGLWGSKPFLHLGERFWLEDEALSIERFNIVDLGSGELEEIILCDQTYSVEAMCAALKNAGFQSVEHFPAWAGLPLNDADEWVVYLAAS